MGLSLGAYLFQPVTEKHSANEEDENLMYGVSSMQGWRETQEDAHNCILNYDTGTSLFAVYDGHGGNEVSEYTSLHLPDFIKNNDFYKKGEWENALRDSFVKFDCTLKEPEVVKILQKLAKYNDGNDEDGSETEEENLGNLKAEAQMSIEEVMAKYISNHKDSKTTSELVKKLSKKVAAVYSKDLVKCSEVNSSDAGGSSKSNAVVKESDSEVSSSSPSSSCSNSRKSLSELYNNNEGNTIRSDREMKKPVLDSTSSDYEKQNSNGNSESILKNNSLDSDLTENVQEYDKIVTEGRKLSCKSEKSQNEEAKIDCNGSQAEEVISSSVENGNTEISSGSKKGKALIKHKKKSSLKKHNESPEKLFQKFINSDSNEDLSESDSDDATFNGPESRSDDDDEDDDDDDNDADADAEEENNDTKKEIKEKFKKENENVDDNGDVEEEESEENDNDNVDDNDDEDDDEEEDEDDDDDEDEDSEDYEYDNEVDRCFIEPGSDSGCTALVALIKDNKLYVANAGDCRCVVSKNGEAIEMSLDHKPENDIELERIEKAGGRVCAGRVNDGLNLSRALGDHVYKRTEGLPPEEQMISPLPDIQVLELDPNIEFMVLACDGIWNSMSSKEVIDFVRPRLQNRNGDLSKICEEMFDHCLAPDTMCDGTGCDNMTAIIVLFKKSNFLSSKKRHAEDSEAEESAKKQKTDDVTSTDSIGSIRPTEGFSEKPSDSPDTTQ